MIRHSKAAKALNAALTLAAAVMLVLAASAPGMHADADTRGDGPEYGMFRLRKSSALPSVTDGNLRYSLSFAQYTLYEDQTCITVARTKTGEKALLMINEDGTSDIVEMAAGTYYMKETKAPSGYAIDKDAHSIEIKNDMTTTYSAADVPKTNPVDVLLQKADAETGIPRPQGGAYLEGAEYTVTYYDDIKPGYKGSGESDLEELVAGKKPAKIGDRDAVWVFRTDASGQVKMSEPDKYLVKEKSAPLYKDSAGRIVIPIGIIKVEETLAPEGYEIDGTARYAQVKDSGQDESLSTLKTFTGENMLSDQVKRGDVRFNKTADGSRTLEGVLFRFTSLTTGESHVLVTGKDGVASSASDWCPHSSSTNAGETAQDGLWFNGYNNESEGAKTDDSLGALPYDRYRIDELRCEANKGYDLISDEVTIDKARVCVDLGTYDNRKLTEPDIRTKARDGASGGKTALADGSVTIIDEVIWSGLTAGETYTVEGVLMDKESGSPVKDKRGGEVRGRAEFTAELPDGSVEVSFELDASALGNRDVVVFEYLKQDGETLASHADMNDIDQTVKLRKTPEPETPLTVEKTPEPVTPGEPVKTPEPEKPPAPELATDARDGESGTGKAVADEKITIIDTVEYRNLTPGVSYKIRGVLMDKASGKALLDDEGKEIRSGAELDAKTASGSIEVAFSFSGKTLAGKDAVVFEYLYLKGSDELIASHADLNSRRQTVRLVEKQPEPVPEKPKKPKSPDTGDPPLQILYCLAVMAAAGELIVLTLKGRNDRLNWK